MKRKFEHVKGSTFLDEIQKMNNLKINRDSGTVVHDPIQFTA